MKYYSFLFFFVLAQAAIARAGAPADKTSMVSDGSGSRLLRVPLSPLGARPSANSSLGAGGFIEAVLGEDGKFTIGTLLGDPGKNSDDNQDLIYGHPGPGTSDTMIRVDGTSFSIHASTSAVTASGDSLSVTLAVGEVQVLERLTIRTSQATGNKDTVEIYFKTTNTGVVSHAVSLRTQLDTLLGSNDGAPFRIAAIGEVTKDIEFDNDPATLAISSIPAQALVLDSLSAPNVISLLTFTGIGFGTPDRVVFGYWPVSLDAWNYTVDPARSFLDNNGDGIISGSNPDSDSSVVVWWGYPDANAFTLAPGESREFAFLYGIGNCNLMSAGPLTVLFCVPSVLEGKILGASFEYPPVNLTAFISNNSAAPVSGGVATLNFTPELQLAAGFSRAYSIEETTGTGSLAGGKASQLDWQLTSKGHRLGRSPISISMDAEGKHGTSLRDMTIQNIPGLLFGQATDDSGNPLAGAAITVFRDGAAVGAAVTQADGTYAVQGLATGSYTLRLSVGGQPDVYISAVVSDDYTTGVTGSPAVFGAGASMQSFSYPNPVRTGRAHISFFTTAAGSCKIQLFTASGELIRDIPYNAAGAGWHSVDWDISGVANGVYLYQVKAGSGRANGKIAVLKRSGR